MSPNATAVHFRTWSQGGATHPDRVRPRDHWIYSTLRNHKEIELVWAQKSSQKGGFVELKRKGDPGRKWNLEGSEKWVLCSQGVCVSVCMDMRRPANCVGGGWGRENSRVTWAIIRSGHIFFLPSGVPLFLGLLKGEPFSILTQGWTFWSLDEMNPWPTEWLCDWRIQRRLPGGKRDWLFFEYSVLFMRNQSARGGWAGATGSPAAVAALVCCCNKYFCHPGYVFWTYTVTNSYQVWSPGTEDDQDDQEKCIKLAVEEGEVQSKEIAR